MLRTSPPKNKCVCCKFDNCKLEFEKHRSNTSFNNLDRQFTTIADFILNPESYRVNICGKHIVHIDPWVKGVYDYFDTLKTGVRLTKIREIK